MMQEISDFLKSIEGELTSYRAYPFGMQEWRFDFSFSHEGRSYTVGIELKDYPLPGMGNILKHEIANKITGYREFKKQETKVHNDFWGNGYHHITFDFNNDITDTSW